MADLSGALGGAVTGATAGAALGPIGAAVGGLLGAAPGLLDLLGVHLFGKSGDQVAQTAMQAIQSVTGNVSPTAADIVGLAPDKAADLRVQLAKIAADAAQAERANDLAEMQAQLADVAGARAQTVQLAQAHSPIALGAPIVSIVVLATFGVVMWVALTRAMPAGSETILTMLLGTLAAMATSVVSYWVGSSIDSYRKTDQLHQQAQLLAAASPVSAAARPVTADELNAASLARARGQ